MRQSKAISPVMGIPLTFRWKLFVSPRRYFWPNRRVAVKNSADRKSFQNSSILRFSEREPIPKTLKF